jgi:hypothetical protein
MTMSEGRPSGGARRRVVRFALWRAVAAAPAVLGGLLLMLGSAALGPWAGLLMLVWAACAGVLMTRVGERIAVRAVCRFHRPGPGQAAALQTAWATALRVTGTKAGDVELYVQTAQDPTHTPPAGAASRSPAGSWRTTQRVDCRKVNWCPCWCTSWAITPRERLGRCCSCRG